MCLLIAVITAKMNGDVILKTVKWMLIGIAAALITAFAVSGSLGNTDADGNYLYIVQTELERTESGLNEIDKHAGEGKMLLPVDVDKLTAQTVTLEHTFSVTDTENNTVNVQFSSEQQMYNDPNVLDHIVVVTNTGNIDGYVRTWFAFEMGGVSEDEFKKSVIFNRNSTDWTWGQAEYGVEIGGEKYAVLCAEYKRPDAENAKALESGKTTPPSLLQVMLGWDVSSDIVRRLDKNNNGKYEILTHSRVVSAPGAWGKESADPWSSGSNQ